jgi:hypothetical protein
VIAGKKFELPTFLLWIRSPKPSQGKCLHNVGIFSLAQACEQLTRQSDVLILRHSVSLLPFDAR